MRLAILPLHLCYYLLDAQYWCETHILMVSNGGYIRLRCCWRHEVEINEVIKDNILCNQIGNMDYDIFIDEDVVDGNVLELGNVSGPESDTNPILSKFVLRTFYIFTECSYTYMISWLQHKLEATWEGVLNVETSFAKLNLSIVVAHREALKKWKKLENSLRVAQHKDHLRLFHKNANTSHQVILFPSMWFQDQYLWWVKQMRL